MTKRDNETLLHVAISFSASNMALTKLTLGKVVRECFGKDPSRAWIKRWLSRHKSDVSPKKTKHLASKRNTTDMLAEVASFIDAVESARERWPMTASNVLNYDETRICVSTDGNILLESKGKQRGNAHDTRPIVLGSLSFISADGEES